ncbi:MAG: hypothetical protein Q8Q42_04575 [Nanoarchaeota archaeon]|nr:hypothetical protein [Nanoarchaeota archaeon]
MANKKGTELIGNEIALWLIAILMLFILIYLISGGWEKMLDLVDKFESGVLFG